PGYADGSPARPPAYHSARTRRCCGTLWPDGRFRQCSSRLLTLGSRWSPSANRFDRSLEAVAEECQCLTPQPVTGANCGLDPSDVLAYVVSNRFARPTWGRSRPIEVKGSPVTPLTPGRRAVGLSL